MCWVFLKSKCRSEKKGDVVKKVRVEGRRGTKTGSKTKEEMRKYEKKD